MGDRIGNGRYELGPRLGHGGMATVYSARDLKLERQVAIKLLKAGLDTDSLLRRFKAERQILAQLSHPNIAHLLDGGVDAEGRPYLVMEFVDGKPVDAWRAAYRLDVQARLRLFLRIATPRLPPVRTVTVSWTVRPGKTFFQNSAR